MCGRFEKHRVLGRPCRLGTVTDLNKTTTRFFTPASKRIIHPLGRDVNRQRDWEIQPRTQDRNTVIYRCLSTALRVGDAATPAVGRDPTACSCTSKRSTTKASNTRHCDDCRIAGWEVGASHGEGTTRLATGAVDNQDCRRRSAFWNVNAFSCFARIPFPDIPCAVSIMVEIHPVAPGFFVSSAVGGRVEALPPQLKADSHYNPSRLRPPGSRKPPPSGSMHDPSSTQKTLR